MGQPINLNPKRARRRIVRAKKMGEPKPSPVGRSSGRSVGDVEASACVGCIEVDEHVAVAGRVVTVARPAAFEA